MNYNFPHKKDGILAEVNAYETKGVKELEILIYTRNTLSKTEDYQLIYAGDCLEQIRELVPSKKAKTSMSL